MKLKSPLLLTLLAAIIGGFLIFKQINDPTDQHGRAAYAHTEALLACGPRPADSEGLKKAQQYISTELAKHGWSTMSQSLVRDTPLGKKTFVNLIARFQTREA